MRYYSEGQDLQGGTLNYTCRDFKNRFILGRFLGLSIASLLYTLCASEMGYTYEKYLSSAFLNTGTSRLSCQNGISKCQTLNAFRMPSIKIDAGDGRGRFNIGALAAEELIGAICATGSWMVWYSLSLLMYGPHPEKAEVPQWFAPVWHSFAIATPLPSAIGVSLVGSVLNQKGSFWYSLIGAVLGAACGTAYGVVWDNWQTDWSELHERSSFLYYGYLALGVAAVIFPTTGAVIGYNMGRHVSEPNHSFRSISSPLVSINTTRTIDNKTVTEFGITLIKVRF